MGGGRGLFILRLICVGAKEITGVISSKRTHFGK